jgi:hypothetical protein
MKLKELTEQSLLLSLRYKSHSSYGLKRTRAMALLTNVEIFLH